MATDHTERIKQLVSEANALVELEGFLKRIGAKKMEIVLEFYPSEGDIVIDEVIIDNNIVYNYDLVDKYEETYEEKGWNTETLYEMDICSQKAFPDKTPEELNLYYSGILDLCQVVKSFDIDEDSIIIKV